jgi:bifunctional DNA-binding transcriptional regulator/antitoxin component of YhaV-PrlF toxin-antitoxin module
MNAFVSKITSRFRTTIPRAVCERLSLRAGDLLCYRIEENDIVIERHEAIDNPFTTFVEWVSEVDERAYKSL